MTTLKFSIRAFARRHVAVLRRRVPAALAAPFSAKSLLEAAPLLFELPNGAGLRLIGLVPAYSVIPALPLDRPAA